MLHRLGGSSGDKKSHKSLSPYGDIKDLRSYYPPVDAVAGSQEGGRKPPHPAASKNQNSSEIHLKAIEEYSGFYQKLLEYGITNLTTEVFKVLKTEGVRLITPNHFRVFDIVSADEKFIVRKVAQSDRTVQRIINEAVSKGYAVLDRGIFYIPKQVWKEYKARYKEVKENPSLSFQIFNLSRLVKLGDSVLIDLDNVSEGDVKRFVKYLHKLGVYPNVWLSASGKGYHIQIDLIYRVVRLREVEEVDSPNGRVKQIVDRGTFYEFPYANDYRIERIEDALKEILRRLGIPYDSVSAKRSVWLEGVYNPIKKGRSVKVFNGKVHRIDKVYENLRPLWEKTLKEKAFKGLKRKRKLQRGTYEVVAEIENMSASNPVDYIQVNLKNGTITVLLNQGLEPYEVGEVLASHYEGDEKAFWRAWRGTENHILSTYRPLRPSKSRKPKERKHRHYWEYIPDIKKALEEGITTIGGISRKAKVPKTAVWEILQKFSREQILNDTDEVIAYLKANQKGGNKLPKEKARELGKRRFEQYFEQFLKELEKKQRRKGDGRRRRYPLGDGKGVSSPMWKPISIDPSGVKLDDKDRSDRALSITPDFVRNGRVEVGQSGPGKGEEKSLLTRNPTGGDPPKEKSKPKPEGVKLDDKHRSDRGAFEKKQPRFVRFYGKARPVEEVERIKPLVVGRRINTDSWKLYEEAVWKLQERGILVAETEETLELMKEEKPLVGRKLLKLIKWLYARKFRQVDLREKPTMEEVLSQSSVRKLDLGGWGRYAFAVYEVLAELKLIDKTTEVRFPNIKPFEVEENIETLLSWEEEVNEYWKRLEEIDQLEAEERNQYHLGVNTEPDNDDRDDELWKLLFGED